MKKLITPLLLLAIAVSLLVAVEVVDLTKEKAVALSDLVAANMPRAELLARADD